MVKGVSAPRAARRQNVADHGKSRVAVGQSSMNSGGEVVLYEAPEGQIRLAEGELREESNMQKMHSASSDKP